MQSIQADYLIRNIDLAVDEWQSGLWAKHLVFEEFCEYILPYRFGSERIEEWREKLIKKYKHRIDWLNGYDQKRNSAYWAALYLNQEIDKEGQYMPPVPFDHTVSYLDNMKIGDCADYAIYAMYIMRACGVPVSVDYTPQWPNRSKRHIWNVLHNNNGKDIAFLGGDIDPGFPHYPSDKFAKIFRHTFAYQQESLFAIKGDEEIPREFDTPFIKDVSNRYFEGIDIQIELSPSIKTRNKTAYLAVFDNQTWIPIHWGQIGKNRKVKFSDMGKGIVYLPVLYEQGRIVPIGVPLIVSETGAIHQLMPVINQTQSVMLKRKFPKFSGILNYSKRVIGAQLVASNDPNFRDSVILGTITRNPLMEYDTLKVNSKDRFRYMKYIAPDNSHCNIAELKIFSETAETTANAKIFTNTEHVGNRSVDKAFDGNELSYYESRDSSGAWIGLDFGEKIKIDYIKYIPRNDDNNIKAGDTYELMYWNNNKWNSLGRKQALTDNITYTDVPINALYLLRNHTAGKEERIFTYEDGVQTWF